MLESDHHVLRVQFLSNSMILLFQTLHYIKFLIMNYNRKLFYFLGPAIETDGDTLQMMISFLI